MSDRPSWDDQFAETEDERNERQRAKRHLRYDKEKRTITSADPRDPDPSREGIFRYHNCARCRDGRDLSKCPTPDRPGNCGYPHARND